MKLRVCIFDGAESRGLGKGPETCDFLKFLFITEWLDRIS